MDGGWIAGSGVVVAAQFGAPDDRPPVLVRPGGKAAFGAQRWFQAKDARLESASVLRCVPLPGPADQLLTEVELRTSAGAATTTS